MQAAARARAPAPRGTSEAIGRGLAPVPAGRLMRRCGCSGGGAQAGEECEECAAGASVHRRARGPSRPDRVPGIVHDVLATPGEPLGAEVRQDMEAAFGHDFGRVRIHADDRAARSADAVAAAAYTSGHHVVFASNRYAPAATEGRRLLAHELAHVAQQAGSSSAGSASPHEVSAPGDPAERQADAWADAALASSPWIAAPARGPAVAAAPGVVARLATANSVVCPAGTHANAPADPQAVLDPLDRRARGLAEAVSIFLRLVSAFPSANPPGNDTERAYAARFGLPRAVTGGFRNRLSGAVSPTLSETLAGEADLMADRYALIATLFESPIIYRCINAAGVYNNCNTHCVDRLASACAGIRAIFLCDAFWGAGDGRQVIALIHEAAHINWTSVDHFQTFRHAECYASLVADLFNHPTGQPACPAP
jgi:hypothetical protein